LLEDNVSFGAHMTFQQPHMLIRKLNKKIKIKIYDGLMC